MLVGREIRGGLSRAWSRRQSAVIDHGDNPASAVIVAAARDAACRDGVADFLPTVFCCLLGVSWSNSEKSSDSSSVAESSSLIYPWPCLAEAWGREPFEGVALEGVRLVGVLVTLPPEPAEGRQLATSPPAALTLRRWSASFLMVLN